MDSNFWEKNADTWTQVIRFNAPESRAVTNAAILKEILRLKPKTLLDLGCGEGWIASQVLPLGIDYTGIDGSKGLIRNASAAYPSAKFFPLDYEEFTSGSWDPGFRFDVAVFNFALFDEEVGSVLKKAASLLSASGTLLIQTLHPCFALTPYQDGMKSEDFRSFPVPLEGVMPWYGRTLSSWVHAFQESGLRLVSIVEPQGASSAAPSSIIFGLCLGA